MADDAVIIGRIAVKVMPDTEDFRREAKHELDKIEKLLKLSATLSVRMDKADLKRVEDQLSDLEDELKPDVKPEISEIAQKAVQARLAVLARDRIVNLIPRVSKTAAVKAGVALAALSGARVVNKYVRDLAETLGNLDKSIPKIAGIGLGIANVGGYALSAASNLFVMSQSLAQIAGAGLALPGILGGLAIGLGATVAVFKDFNTVLPEVAGKIHGLQDSMSEKFWARAKAPIREMINTLFPQFQKGIEGTSRSLGGFFANLSTSIKEAFDGKLAPMFENLNKSIDISGKYTDNFANIIKTLGLTGSEYLPRLATWFGDIAKQFDGWLTTASKDGRLKGWIEEGITELKALGKLAHGVGSTLAGVARAANNAGGSSLTMMADTMERVAKVVNGTTFQNALTGVFKAAHEGMSEISNKAGPAFKSFMLGLAGTLESVLPSAGRTAGTAIQAVLDGLNQPAVINGIISMFAGIERGISGLAPAMKPLGKAFGAVLEIIGALAENLGPVLASAITPLSNAIVTLKDPIIDIINILGPALAKIFDAIAPVVESLAKGIAKIIESVTKNGDFQKFVDSVVHLAEAVSPIVVGLVNGLADAIARFAPGLMGEVAAEIEFAAKKIEEIQKSLDGGGKKGKGKGGDSFWERQKLAIADLFNGGGIESESFADRVGGALSGIDEAFTNWASSTGTTIQGWDASINASISGAWSSASTSTSTFLSGIGTTISGWSASTTTQLQTWGTFLSTTISGTWASASTSTSTFFSGLGTTIAGWTSSTLATISRWGSSLRTGISLAWSSIPGIVSGAWTRVREAIGTGISNAVAKVGELPGKIKGALGDVRGLLLGAGRAIISGLLDGMKEAAGPMIRFAAGLGKKIKAVKGPLSYDKIMLFPEGKAIINGLRAGMQSQEEGLLKTVRGITQTLAATTVPTLFKTGSSMITSLSAGIESQSGAVAKALKTVSQEFKEPLRVTAIASQASKVTHAVNSNLAGDKSTQGVSKTLIYNAADGPSLSAEEKLFDAASRARMEF